jgi:hypothetical protein
MGTEKWTNEAIRNRILAWNTRYGQPPRSSDWAHSGADVDGAFPSEATVKAKFGSWNKAIGFAKLAARVQGRPSKEATLTNASFAGTTTANVSWNTSIPNTGLYGCTTPPTYYYSYPVYTDTGAQKKLDALKAVLEQDPETPASVLLAIIDA